MKRTFIFIPVVIIILLPAISFSQAIQPIIGIAFSETNCSSVRTEEGEQYRPGLLAGLGYEHHVSSKWCLALEATYVSKGYNYYNKKSAGIAPGTFTVSDYYLKQNYLEFPLTMKKLFNFHHQVFFLEGGPFLGVGLGGRYKGNYYTYLQGSEQSCLSWDRKIVYGDTPENGSTDKLYVDHRLDYGYVLGAGVILCHKICLDFRYVHGIVEDKEELNQSLEFCVGVPIALHHQKH